LHLVSHTKERAIAGRSPRQRLERQAQAHRGVAGNEVAALRAQEPGGGLPPAGARFFAFGVAPERQRMADRLVQSLLEDLAQPGALERVVEARVEGIDVRRELALAPQVVPGVLIRREHVLRIEPDLLGEGLQERGRLRRRRAVVDALVGEERGIVPYRLAVLAPVAGKRPARQLLTR